jgi:predicted dehydrogenase
MGSVGVIGAGYWGPNLIRNFVAGGAFDQVFACDKDATRLDSICKRIPSVPGCSDVAELLANPAIEAIAIATPVRSHFALAKAALERGKHVLIEKPMTFNSREAEELIVLAASKGLMLMVDHTFLFTGAVEKMREIVRSGDLGQCYYIDSVRVNLGLFQNDVNVIWDLTPHDLSIIAHALDAHPKLVRAIGHNHARQGMGHGMVDVAYLNVEYREGFSAMFHASWLSPTKVRRMVVAGSKRMIVWDDMEAIEKLRVYDKGVELRQVSADDPSRIQVEYRTGDVYVPKLETTEALLKMTTHFADCCRGKATPICGGEKGLDVVRVLEASQMSLENGSRAVAIEDGKLALM